MAYGTAPHRVRPGVWATQDGRILTPAGSAYWEHHHQQGYVTADGHATQKAKSRAFGAVIDPTRPVLPAPPPPRAAPGRPTITRKQWKEMTPDQKMATQVTVTLTPRERAQLKKRQDAQVAAARKKGLTVTGIPAIPTKINQPIGFGGASSIDQRMAAIDAWEARVRTERKKFDQSVKSGLISPEKAQASAEYNAAHPHRGGGFLSHTGLPAIAHGVEAGLGAVGSFGTAMGQGVATELGLNNLGPFDRKQVDTGMLGSPIPGVSPKTIQQGGQFTGGALNLTLGPHLAHAILTGNIDSPGGLGVDVGLMLPGTGFIAKPLRAIREGRIAARAARAGEAATRAAVDVAKIPERTARIEEWTRAGWKPDEIQNVLAFFDNSAALSGDPAAWWRDAVQLPTGETPVEQAARAGRTLYQETPEARAAKAKARAADAKRPTNWKWRNRQGIPQDMKRSGFVDMPVEVPSSREGNIPDVVFPPEEQRKRLIAKLFPQGNAPAGIPTTKDIFKQSDSGEWFKLAGDITPEDWVQRVRAVVKDPELIDNLAHWYTIYRPSFTRVFGEDAPEVMRAFAVSQANASPASGLTAVLKVMDRLAAGNPLTRNEYSVVGLNIQKAVQDKEITSHVAAKLSDFVDSLAGSNTRTWMGHDPRAGSPVAVDVHAIRDRGFIDKKLQAKVEAAGFKLGKDFKLEGNGAASGALYERIAEWYHEIADHLNDIGFNGRHDWTPAQAQALGWSTIQKAHGVIPEGFAEAFAYNTRGIGFEVTKGATGLGSDLTTSQARQVAKAMLPHARALAEDIPGIYVRDVRVGLGGWNQGSNAMLTIDVVGSKQAVQDSLQHFAQAFDQEWVQASREVSGKNSRATLIISSPKFKNPRSVEKFWRALNKIEPKLEGFMPYDLDGTPAIAIRTDSRSLSPKTAEKFRAKWQGAIEQAEQEVGYQVGYTGRNVELLTGGQHGAVDPLQTLPGSGGGRRLGALEHPRSAGIRDALEREIDRVRAGEPAAPRGEPGELAGRTLYQRSPDPASTLPKGATEFLEGGKTRMHFFEGATPDTAMHELVHVLLPDLRGRHFLTLADEYAGGKALHLWTDEEHEAVAQAWEQWLRTGEVTNPKLKGPFEAIREFMLKLIGKAKGSGYRVPKDVEDAFNYMLREPPDARLKKDVVEAAHRAKTEVYPIQEIKRKQERAVRFEESEAAREAAGGGALGQQAALEKLQGEYWKEPFNDLTHLDEADMEYLINEVGKAKKLRGIQKTSLIQAIQAAQRGEVFRPSDSDLVFKAFGHTKATRKGLTRTQRALDILTQIVNIPRSFMSSFDVSGILRQGLMTVVMHPVMSAKLTPSMMRYLFSERYYLERMARFRNDPRYDLLTREGGLELTDTGHEFGSEEAYQSHIAETLTGGKYGPVRASGRAYTGLLNDMRWGSATNMFDLAKENNMLTGEELRRIGKVSNWATGRGTLGKHEQSAQLMNLFLFSPRLLSSRLQTFNPWFYKSLDPEQRLLFIRWANRTPAQKQALKATSRLLLAGGSILALAKLAGADIELNPTSSDFGKIKVGNTRVDIWGGHQSIVRTFFQTLLRERKNTTSGQIVPTHDVLDPIFRFFEGKASPPFSLALDIHRGKTFTGDPLYWGDPRKAPWDAGSFWNPKANLGSRLWPLGFQDTWEAYGQADDAAVAALIFALSQVGFSTQTYPPDEKKSGGRDWGVDTGSSGGGGRTDWGVDTGGGTSGGRTDWGIP